MKQSRWPTQTFKIKAGSVFLRPLTIRDAPACLEAIETSRVELRPWMLWEEQTDSLDDVITFIRNTQRARRTRTEYALGIFDIANHQFVGSAGLRELNQQHSSATLGYWIRSDRHREGLAYAAATALLQFGFEELGLHRIQATTHVANRASRGVLRKLGLVKEGVLRDYYYVSGVFSDHVIFSMLRQDWDFRIEKR